MGKIKHHFYRRTDGIDFYVAWANRKIHRINEDDVNIYDGLIARRLEKQGKTLAVTHDKVIKKKRDD